MYNDTDKGYIQTLIDIRRWQEAYNCLQAYIEENGMDSWAKNTLALVESHLND